MIVRVTELNESYKRLIEVHNLIGEKIKFVVNSKTGFLVSSLEEIGGGGFGLTVEVNGKRQTVKAKFGESAEDTVNSLINTHSP